MKSEITNGIIYSHNLSLMSDLRHTYVIMVGFYNDKVNDKKQLIEIIKRAGDHTTKLMNGKVVNLFDEDESIKIKENGSVAVVSLAGYEWFLDKQVYSALEKNGEIQKMDDIVERAEKVKNDEEEWLQLIESVREEYNLSCQEAVHYVMGDRFSIFNTEPSFKKNFATRIPKIAEETGLTHLAFLPIYDKFRTLENNIISFLTARRESRDSKVEMLYVNGAYIPLKNALSSIEVIQ